MMRLGNLFGNTDSPQQCCLRELGLDPFVDFFAQTIAHPAAFDQAR